MKNPLHLLLRSCPANERVHPCYGLVATDPFRARHYVAPIPLNLLLRIALEVWMRLRNPVSPGSPDVLGTRFHFAKAYEQGYRAGYCAGRPDGVALVYRHPTPATVAAAWGLHADAEELARRVLEAAIATGPAYDPTPSGPR
jgi:hypothetical protein